MSTLNDVKIINLPKIEDPQGNLSFIEEKKHIPFEIQRVYWIYDVPGGQFRGSHAYKKLCEYIVALSGSFDVVLDDGKEKKKYQLNRSYYGLYVPGLICIWISRSRYWNGFRIYSFSNSIIFILVMGIKKLAR